MNDKTNQDTVYTFTTPDFAYVGTTENFVTALHDRSLAPAKDDREFMRQVAQRMELIGHRVRHDSVENFVDDMIKADQLVMGPAPFFEPEKGE